MKQYITRYADRFISIAEACTSINTEATSSVETKKTVV